MFYFGAKLTEPAGKRCWGNITEDGATLMSYSYLLSAAKPTRSNGGIYPGWEGFRV